jgi:hypothetical protein
MEEKLTEGMLIWYATISIRMFYLCFLSSGLDSLQSSLAKLSTSPTSIRCITLHLLLLPSFGLLSLISSMIKKISLKSQSYMTLEVRINALEQRYSGDGLLMQLLRHSSSSCSATIL